MRDPLSYRLEYAILDAVSQAINEDRQHNLAGWETVVKLSVPDYSKSAYLVSAFKNLRNDGVLELTKPDNSTRQRHAFVYSGNPADDDWFFFDALLGFNAKLTDPGRRYWDGIRVEKKSTAIGFPH